MSHADTDKDKRSKFVELIDHIHMGNTEMQKAQLAGLAELQKQQNVEQNKNVRSFEFDKNSNESKKVVEKNG